MFCIFELHTFPFYHVFSISLCFVVNNIIPIHMQAFDAALFCGITVELQWLEHQGDHEN